MRTSEAAFVFCFDLIGRNYEKIKNLPENNFLILFFLLFSLAFLIASLVALDRAFLFEGMEQILTQPCKIPTNYFAVGGYSATFFNMGLVTLACLGLYLIFRAELNNVATLAIMLTVGFASWGIDILNIWPTVFGTMLYCVVKKRTMKNYVSAMLFTTGIAPLISDLLTRYPYETTVGFTPQGAVLAIVVGLVSGFFIPAGLTHAPNVHKGFDLYSAALPIGMTAFLLQTVLYKAPGVALPAAPAGETLQVASAMAANLFCGIVFGLCIVFALLMGAKPKDYWKMLTEKDQVSSVTAAYGNAVFLLNVGLFGLMILGYYDLVGGAFNGITFGIIFCMLATCNSGSNPATVWPILLGYVAASYLFRGVSALTGGQFAQAINAQAILVGLCYANGLSPITAKYGWQYGFAAAVVHYCLVTTVPSLHGGFCLYNGGFTAALTCILVVPQLERFARTKLQRLEAKKR